MFSSSLFDDLTTYPGSAWKKGFILGSFCCSLKDACRILRRQRTYTGPGRGQRGMAAAVVPYAVVAMVSVALQLKGEEEVDECVVFYG